MATRLLWVDDEIELLKPHILFLKEKGYEVDTVNNGSDAIDMVHESDFDLVFLDENMPGINGLETLSKIKEHSPSLPIIMITKSEEESIMEEAIGSKISDYLIKPVNPNQILLSVKKNIDHKRLESERATINYQQEFRQIGMTLGGRLNSEEWKDVYKKLVYWDLELEKIQDEGMFEILKMQKKEADQQFCKFYENNYKDWLNNKTEDTPLLSHKLMEEKVFPHLDKEPLFFIVIDNLRYDQWRVLRPLIFDYFRVEEEEIYYSIIPTATQYARNAIFSGLLPSEMERRHPDLWKNDEDEGGKNMFEKEFLQAHISRKGMGIKSSYNKITTQQAGRKLNDNFANLLNNDLNAIVYNFVDMLSHARTDMKMIKELADDESAYRSLTKSWFEHSSLKDMLIKISEAGAKVVITTDHGTTRVNDPVKIVGTKDTNTNLRYKRGKNMDYKAKDVFEIKNPKEYFLPQQHVSTKFVFTREDTFFAYPNNYNYYVQHYRDTFQHGGISIDEVLIPVVLLKKK